mgnify:FL=1|tara:strand:- start:10569 stop:10784 length:216 start_codon:yes stop_codon:yes gene_type:complete
MGLLDKLNTNGSNLSQFDGTTPPLMTSANPQSNVHNEYSINGNPNLNGYPSPSNLDLDGVTPPKYLDNPPQ